METIVKDKRDLIKTKNGYFRYTLTGAYSAGVRIDTGGHDCQFRFQLPPLNEMGFSDQYNQCLVMFRSIRIQCGANTANGNWGNNATFYGKTGGPTHVPNGIQLVSNIPCRNQAHFGAGAQAFWTQNSGIFAPTLSQKLDDEVVLAPSAQLGAVDTSLNLLGTWDSDLQGTTAGSAASNVVQVNRNNVWTYKTDKDIWSGGMLCGIPMGTDLTFEIKDLYNGTTVALSSASTHKEGAITGISIELEIQLLPNPTP